uniref:Uncharacterized protein n=1 Tax=Fundulus heteroclitus TaxID=8078 RepID=A0A3Q2P6Y8_FUNHE
MVVLSCSSPRCPKPSSDIHLLLSILQNFRRCRCSARSPPQEKTFLHLKFLATQKLWTKTSGPPLYVRWKTTSGPPLYVGWTKTSGPPLYVGWTKTSGPPLHVRWTKTSGPPLYVRWTKTSGPPLYVRWKTTSGPPLYVSWKKTSGPPLFVRWTKTSGPPLYVRWTKTSGPPVYVRWKKTSGPPLHVRWTETSGPPLYVGWRMQQDVGHLLASCLQHRVFVAVCWAVRTRAAHRLDRVIRRTGSVAGFRLKRRPDRGLILQRGAKLRPEVRAAPLQLIYSDNSKKFSVRRRLSK